MPTSLTHWLTDLRRALAQDGFATAPVIDGCSARALPRLLWSTLADTANGALSPVVELDTDLADRKARADAAAQAGGGLLITYGRGEPPERGRAQGIRVDPDRVVSVTDAERARLHAADLLHTIVADPALAPVRRALAAHCAPGAAVHIVGPASSGKRALARWAHAQASGRLAVVSRDTPRRPERGDWALFEEVQELSPDGWTWLADRLRPTDPAISARPARGTRPPHPELRGIHGESEALCDVLHEVVALAPSRHAALVLGETGSGKEGLARAIHALSGRTGAFVALDVGAMSEELADSELFGHARGAFTGADRARPGAFRAADKGTLFLDEIGNLSPRNQARLLRALQEGAVRPVGEDAAVPVDVRVVAATHADLPALVARGAFREDLLRRLDTFVLRLPPLRDRGTDAVSLANALLEAERPGLRLTDDAAQAVLHHPWPGNVRELQSVMIRAAVRSEGAPAITAAHLAAAGVSSALAAPTITTRSAADDSPWTPALPASVAHRMTAVTLRVPALQDRDPSHLRALILASLDGHPIRSDALDLLVRQPWWGQLAELQAALAAARRTPAPIDVARLSVVLPGLNASPDLRPIEVLLFPAPGAHGVDGLRGRYSTRALIIGRVAGPRELDAAVARQPERKAWLDEVADPAACACLPLRFLPDASRIQAVIGRDEAGLVVHAPPWARLSVWAASLEQNAEPRPVSPDTPMPIGAGGELRLVDANQTVRLALYVFAGGVAFEDLAPVALARSGGAAAETLFGGGAEAADRSVTRRWVLDEAEARALVHVITTFPGGEFKAWVVQAGALLDRKPELQRLAAFLRTAPNPADYLGRLLEYEGNEGAIRALAARFAQGADGQERLTRLPVRLRRLVGHDAA